VRRSGAEDVRFGAAKLRRKALHELFIFLTRPRGLRYKYVDIVPTHVHPNFARLHFADLGDDYVPYNKPGSIKHWLENANVTEDIVFFIDADMIFLR
jgi:hypothetical protein